MAVWPVETKMKGLRPEGEWQCGLSYGHVTCLVITMTKGYDTTNVNMWQEADISTLLKVRKGLMIVMESWIYTPRTGYMI